MKYKVGTKVRVVQCYSGGNFDVGDVVEIIQIGDDDGSAPDCYGAISPYDGMKWYLQEDEVGSNTNADRIRTENDEQLAIFIKELMFNDFKPACKKSAFFSAEYKPECEEDCVSCILQWLQHPAEEDT